MKFDDWLSLDKHTNEIHMLFIPFLQMIFRKLKRTPAESSIKGSNDIHDKLQKSEMTFVKDDKVDMGV